MTKPPRPDKITTCEQGCCDYSQSPYNKCHEDHDAIIEYYQSDAYKKQCARELIDSGALRVDEERSWRLLRNVKECKPSGKDCNSKHCSNYFGCKILIETLCEKSEDILSLN